MPNYIRNKIAVSGREQYKEVFDFVKGKDTLFDFNTIVPMPEGLDVDNSSIGDAGMEYLYQNREASFNKTKIEELKKYLDDRHIFDEAIKLGRQYLMNIANTGCKTWYTWCSRNWGTKWNAIQPSISDNIISFETAWNAVVPLIESLSLLFPDIVFTYTYADEDLGYNCGKGIIQNGISIMKKPDGGSHEAYDLAFELWSEYKENYTLKGDKYVSIE